MSYLRAWLRLVVFTILLASCADVNNDSGSNNNTDASNNNVSGQAVSGISSGGNSPQIVVAEEKFVAFKGRRVAIVYSETSAKQYFDEFAYGQLFTAMQHQAMQAGIPYDLLTESDLVNAAVLVGYDAVIIPVMSHIDGAIRNQVISALQTAQQNGLAIITSSEFLTYDQNNQPFTSSYSAMIDLLGLTPKVYKNGVQAELKVVRNDHPITSQYQPNELVDNYAQTWFAEFSPVSPDQSVTLVEATVGNDKHAVVQVMEHTGRVVHFSNDEFLADNNLLWNAIRWAIYGDRAPISLLTSRAPGLFIARNDMDQAMVARELINNEIPLLDIVKDWKQDYNFVGSFYIDIGNNPAQGLYTDWSVSAPLYAEYLALDNEFGTHSWTHPHHTAQLTN